MTEYICICIREPQGGETHSPSCVYANNLAKEDYSIIQDLSTSAVLLLAMGGEREAIIELARRIDIGDHKHSYIAPPLIT